MKEKDVFYLYIIVVLLFLAFGCSPVKQVEKDISKTKKVFEFAVKNYGWCVNDTVIQSKSDTLVSFDTLYSIETNTDTLLIDKEKPVIKTKYITKTVTIKDTLTKVVTDRTKENILQREIESLRSQIVTLKETIAKKDKAISSAKHQRNTWIWMFFLAVIFIARKPIGNLIKTITL